MKKVMLGLFVTTSLFMTSCSDDDDNGNVIGGEETTTYDLRSSTDGSVIGTTTMRRNADNTTTIMVEDNGNGNLDGQSLSLNTNTAAENDGENVLSLNDYDAATGRSTTTFDAYDDGTPVTYEDLNDFNGHIGVYNDNETEHMAYSDIGQNRLTGESRSYDLMAEGETEANGTVTFERRMNNTTLATVHMNNMNDMDSYPVRMYQDNYVDGTNSLMDFEMVNGTTGMSHTQIDMWEDGTEVSYNDLMDYDGHIRVHQSMEDMDNVRARADIGQNELTGNAETYNLDAYGDSNVNGTITMQERMNGETLATMNMDNTAAGVDHPAYINSGIAGTDIGVPSATLNTVNGATGMGYTNLSTMDNGTAWDYNTLMDYDGHVNVYSTTDPLSGIAAQGNIGANVE